MRRRDFIKVICVTVVAWPLAARAQQPSDTDAVKAANDAFYAALSSRDLKTMEAVWSKNQSTILIGPSTKNIIVGWDAIQKYWVSVFDLYSQISISFTVTQGQTDGTMAWIVGTETAQLQFKRGGAPVKYEAFVTNVFQKAGNRWLLITHQSQVVAK